MNSRKDSIKTQIEGSNKPISGSNLAKTHGVSRQVIVHDIALLRTEGMKIIATSNGYILERKHNRRKRIIACKHTQKSELIEELNLIVSMGGVIEDVIIEHPVYGELTGKIMIDNRAEVIEFTDKLYSNSSKPISTITGGIHLHTISAKSEMLLDAIENVLLQSGILLKSE